VTSDIAVQQPTQNTATAQDLADSILDTLVHRIGKDAQAALPHDWLAATILTVRNDIVERWMASTSPRLRRSNPMRRSAMAGSGGWRRASWRAWRASRSLLTAMESAM
jgi:hypothetical protein